MRTAMHLTIQDYFRKAGALHRRTPATVSPATAKSFSRVLSQATAASPIQRQGWSIRDYLAHPLAHGPRDRSRVEDAPLAGAARAAPPATVEPPAPETTAGPRHIEHMPAQVMDPTPHTEAGRDPIQAGIEKAARRYDLPPALIEAVIRAESNFDVRAVSPAGAQGLMQLMPRTAQELGVSDPFDADANIDGGARYLRQMLNRFNGNIRIALSAYNAGPGTVDRFDGQVPYAETRSYVRRVLAYTREAGAGRV